MRRHRICKFATVLILSRFALPQTPALPSTDSTNIPLIGIVTGSPYSADEVIERSSYVLPDGSRVTNHRTAGKHYRDALGRTRFERVLAVGPTNRTTVEIIDPVAHLRYSFDDESKVVHRQPIRTATDLHDALPDKPSGIVNMASGATLDIVNPEDAVENLGSKTMEGLVCNGKRTTRIWPGREHPWQAVNETWQSPELRVLVLVKQTSGQAGETIQKLVNIRRGEPGAD